MVQAVAAVASMAGPLVKGSAGLEAGKYNRKISYAMADDALREGAAQEARIREVARAQMGEQIGAQASNGFQIGTGSALDALTESQINATLDALNVRREAASKARGLQMQGEQALAAGKNEAIGGVLSAISAGADWASSKGGK